MRYRCGRSDVVNGVWYVGRPDDISFFYEVRQTRRTYHLEKMIGDTVLKIDSDIEKLRNDLIDTRFR